MSKYETGDKITAELNRKIDSIESDLQEMKMTVEHLRAIQRRFAHHPRFFVLVDDEGNLTGVVDMKEKVFIPHPEATKEAVKEVERTLNLLKEK